jgi:hypothetical protein
MTVHPFHSWQARLAVRGLAAIGFTLLLSAGPAVAQSCSAILGLLQQGRSTEEIVRMTGWPAFEVEGCRREYSRPIIVGPSGVPPHYAPGPPPRGAAGPPPLGGAVGAPPVGGPGPAPVGREVQRLK